MCNVFVKVILFCITILTLLICAALVALPIINGYKLDIDFDDIKHTEIRNVPIKLLNIFHYNVIYISYLAFGIVTICTGFIGMLAISKKNCFARWLYCMITLVMAVVAGCSIYIANMYHKDFFYQSSKLSETANSVRQMIIPSEYKADMFVIQDSMHCCGLITPRNVSDTCFGWSKKAVTPMEKIDDVCKCTPKSGSDRHCIELASFETQVGKNNNCAFHSKLGNLISKKSDPFVYSRGCLDVIWEWVNASLLAVFGINLLATLATCWLCCFDKKDDKTESNMNLMSAY